MSIGEVFYQMIMETIEYIGMQNLPIFARWMMLFGFISMIQSLGKFSVDVVVLVIRIFGIGKWIVNMFEKLRKRLRK